MPNMQQKIQRVNACWGLFGPLGTERKCTSNNIHPDHHGEVREWIQLSLPSFMRSFSRPWKEGASRNPLSSRLNSIL